MKLSRTLEGSRRLAALAAWQRVLARDVWNNPIMRKELRGRMRAGRTFVTLSVYVALLSLFLPGVYAMLVDSSAFSPSPYSAAYSMEEIGKTLLGMVVGMEMLLIGFIAPTLTTSAISGERERQTYDLLRVTLLPARTLVAGKLAAALAYVGLLLVVAVPLQSVAFFFGDIDAADVWLSLWVMLLEALFLATAGLYFSTYTRRTFSANILTYAAIAFVVFGLPFIGGMMTLDLNAGSYQAPNAATVYIAGVLLCFNPPLVLLMTHAVYTQHQSLFTFTYTATNGQTLTLASPWIVFSVLYLGLTVILLWSAIRRVRRVEA